LLYQPVPKGSNHPGEKAGRIGEALSGKALDRGRKLRALRIHRDLPVFDGHNDLPWALRERGPNAFETTDLRQPQPELHTDIPRLLKGGVGAQFWSVYVPSRLDKSGEALETTLEQVDLVRRVQLPASTHVLVGGQSAWVVDVRETLRLHTPAMVLFIASAYRSVLCVL